MTERVEKLGVRRPHFKGVDPVLMGDVTLDTAMYMLSYCVAEVLLFIASLLCLIS
jgi:hypothetical protein